MSNISNDSNPYAATTTLETLAPPSQYGSYGGIGRMAYFGYSFLAVLIYNGIVAAVGAAGNGAPGGGLVAVIGIALLVYLAALLYIVAQRMINCGYSPWWCVGTLVPLLNILVGFRCIACPEGYADHRTLDTAGKIWVGLFVALILLVVVAIAVAMMQS